MAVAYVDVLKAKRADVVRELEELRRQSAELATRVTTKEAQLRNLDDLLALEGPPRSAASDMQSPSETAPRHFLERAYEAVRAAGQPIHYRVLAQQLANDGVY